jgi:hypothetical protein
MRKSRFTEDQIVGILKEHAAVEPTGSLCRHHGISQQTLSRWKHKYDGAVWSWWKSAMAFPGFDRSSGLIEAPRKGRGALVIRAGVVRQFRASIEGAVRGSIAVQRARRGSDGPP